MMAPNKYMKSKELLSYLLYCMKVEFIVHDHKVYKDAHIWNISDYQ